jgi:pimeloyl-ACP methyl ester carboxylesterase
VPDTPESRAHRAALETAFAAELRDAAGLHGFVETFAHDGDPREAARLVAHVASPGRGRPASRPTLLFLHGKGGFAAEWRRDAARAVRLGYNVLVPELRAHPPSGGERITYGFLEKEDLALLVGEASRRFGLDPARVGVDGCSMGALLALHVAAGNPRVRALWLQAPFADLPAMAVQYLHRATLLPPWLVAAPARLAVAWLAHASGLPLADLDPVVAARSVLCPAMLIHGEDDELVPPASAPPLHAALGGEKALWLVPRCGHCHHADEPSGLRSGEYRRRWIRFFRRALPVR